MKKNDQGHIIEAIKKKEYDYVWDKVKYIGVNEMPNMNFRYLVFKEVLDIFDPERNNNFIHFYKKFLQFSKFNDKDNLFVITPHFRQASTMLRERISPTDEISDFLKELNKWNI